MSHYVVTTSHYALFFTAMPLLLSYTYVALLAINQHQHTPQHQKPTHNTQHTNTNTVTPTP